MGPKSRELVVCAGLDIGCLQPEVKLSYQEAVSLSTKAMQAMAFGPIDLKMPHGWERYWTEHSERSRGDGQFVVVYNKINRGCLHRTGPSGCWMAKRRDFQRSELYEMVPEEHLYSTR